FGPDSNRWYIRRWDDETAQGEPGAFAARPAAGAGLAAWRTVGAARAASGITATTAGVRAVAPVALSDAPLVASWGYAKAYYRLLAVAATLRAPPSSPAR
ncbi:MAG: hypothetical protein AAB113_01525, partial [Candidatus Eisenbacteria bacterium]